MDQFGVRTPRLRALAKTPQWPVTARGGVTDGAQDNPSCQWLGATVQDITGAGEASAFGLPGASGVLVVDLTPGGPLAADYIGNLRAISQVLLEELQ